MTDRRDDHDAAAARDVPARDDAMPRGDTARPEARAGGDDATPRGGTARPAARAGGDDPTVRGDAAPPQARSAAPRRPARSQKPAALAYAGSAIGFAVVLAALSWQVAAGGDPAIGAGEQAAATPERVLVRRIVRRVIVTREAPAPSAPAAAPSAETPAARGPSTPTAPAPAPAASAPAPPSTRSS